MAINDREFDRKRAPKEARHLPVQLGGPGEGNYTPYIVPYGGHVGRVVGRSGKPTNAGLGRLRRSAARRKSS